MTGARPVGEEILNLGAEKFKQVLHIQVHRYLGQLSNAECEQDRNVFGVVVISDFTSGQLRVVGGDPLVSS